MHSLSFIAMCFTFIFLKKNLDFDIDLNNCKQIHSDFTPCLQKNNTLFLYEVPTLFCLKCLLFFYMWCMKVQGYQIKSEKNAIK